MFSASNSKKITFLSSKLAELLAVESKKLNLLLIRALFLITTISQKNAPNNNTTCKMYGRKEKFFKSTFSL